MNIRDISLADLCDVGCGAFGSPTYDPTDAFWTAISDTPSSSDNIPFYMPEDFEEEWAEDWAFANESALSPAAARFSNCGNSCCSDLQLRFAANDTHIAGPARWNREEVSTSKEVHVASFSFSAQQHFFVPAGLMAAKTAPLSCLKQPLKHCGRPSRARYTNCHLVDSSQCRKQALKLLTNAQQLRESTKGPASRRSPIRTRRKPSRCG